MGSGKTQSAITYMNEHKSQKFIYITPYLAEAARIKQGCRELKFFEPSDKLPEFNFRKCDHTAALIKDGCNITTTHQAFKGYNANMLADIEKQGYTLFIDESLDALESVKITQDDLDCLLECGCIKENDGAYSRTGKEYRGALKKVLDLFDGRELIRAQGARDDIMFYWQLPPDLMKSFEQVFVLTYLFEGQNLFNFFQIFNIPFKYIGVEKDPKVSTGFRFSEHTNYIPDYVQNLKEMVNMLKHDKLNRIGKDKCSLSMTWFQKSRSNRSVLKNAIYNCFCNIWRQIPAKRKLWGTFSEREKDLKGRGYSKSFLTFNARATNEYSERTHLVYAANVFMNGDVVNFYAKNGVKIDQEKYALSVMLQWIWRSAIRDGKKIYIYIPSKRMRDLLNEWMDEVTKNAAKAA